MISVFSLKDACTFRIGGVAKYFIKVSDQNEFLESIEFAKKVGLPIFVYGGGSNLLFPDTGLDAVLIRIVGSQIYMNNDQTINVSAGTHTISFHSNREIFNISPFRHYSNCIVFYRMNFTNFSRFHQWQNKWTNCPFWRVLGYFALCGFLGFV